MRTTVFSRFDVAADELVRLADRDTLDDSGHKLERAQVDGAGIAGDADGGASGAGNGHAL